MTHMNRLLYAADCLDVLNDAEKLPDQSVDLIYLDPPFNSNSTYNLPFKSRDRSLKPVEAFEDTWRWQADDDERLSALEKNPKTRSLATIVQFAQGLESGRGKISLAAYLLNMAQRLYAMRRVLKATGSIYLHCDTSAGHYLKLMMDGIFGAKRFRNAITWRRYGSHNDAKKYGRVYDMILYYSNGVNVVWNGAWTELEQDYIDSNYRYEDKRGRYTTAPLHTGGLSGGGYSYEFDGHVRTWRYSEERMRELDLDKRLHRAKSGTGPPRRKVYLHESKGKPVSNMWTDISALTGNHNERLGYPTQKPLALLERIIKASSNPGDLVLDPFCGCGTTAHAAEKLGRKWIGVDISRFSTGLVSRRLLDNFAYLNRDDIAVLGTPQSVADARSLAQRDKFEFEKWVCGAMGANGMYKNPGEKGADGGIDGVVELPVIRQVGSKFESQAEYVIIQVKGGNVSPDAVKALSETVRRLGAVAGIMVCFRDQMGTVENQRSKELWADAYQQYPVIQGFSIEDMLADQRPNLPPTWGYKHGGKTSAPHLL